MPRTEPLLTSADVAAQLRVSRRTVARLVRAGQLPACHVTERALRFLQADIDGWVAGRRAEPVAVATVVPEPVYDDKPRIRPELVTYRGRTVKQRTA